MQIAPGTVVSFDYTLFGPDGAVIDASQGTPLSYLHGGGHIVAGLERQMAGRVVGDAFTAEVPAAEGYGEPSGRAFRVGRDELPPGMDPQVGMTLGAQGPDGEMIPLFVTAVDAEGLTLTPDHPLAGVPLRFEIAVRAVRAATAEEMAHGHAHGHGGHDHGHGH